MKAEELCPWVPAKVFVSRRFDAMSKIKTVTVPVLIAQARADILIPFERGKQMFDAVSSPKEFVPYCGRHNDDVFQVKIGVSFAQELETFLKQNNNNQK